jgi:hypothetical protein
VKIDRPITKLLNGGRAWCRKAGAMDRQGRPCSTRSPLAVKWCLMGALENTFRDERNRAAARLRLLDGIPENSFAINRVVTWNDAPERTWPQVAALLKNVGL